VLGWLKLTLLIQNGLLTLIQRSSLLSIMCCWTLLTA